MLGNSIEDNFKNINIDNFYMVGDNHEVDIKGANLSNFISVLVK